MNDYTRDYIERLGKKSVDELTDAEVEAFFDNDGIPESIKCNIICAKGIIGRGIITYDTFINSLRKSMETGERFVCTYIVNERVCLPDTPSPKETGWVIKP